MSKEPIYDHGWHIYRQDDFGFHYHCKDEEANQWVLVGGEWNKTPNAVMTFRSQEEVKAAKELLNRMMTDMIRQEDYNTVAACVEQAAEDLFKDIPNSSYYGLRTRAFNGIMRAFPLNTRKDYTENNQLIITRKLAYASHDELAKIRNVGGKSLKIVERAQQLAQLYLQERRKNCA